VFGLSSNPSFVAAKANASSYPPHPLKMSVKIAAMSSESSAPPAEAKMQLESIYFY